MLLNIKWTTDRKTMRTYTKLRASDTTLTCISCELEKEVKKFPRQGKYKDGTPRYKSRCRTCTNLQRRVERRRGTKERIISFEAPISAAVKLMRHKPEVLADFARRYHFDYIPLLQEERERMTTKHKRHCQAMSEALSKE
jgi:hypothetical protein